MLPTVFGCKSSMTAPDTFRKCVIYTSFETVMMFLKKKIAADIITTVATKAKLFVKVM